MTNPKIPRDEYNKPLSSGGNMEPLELLPERTWLNAVIAEVKYQYAIFNNEIQYIKDQDDNEILDENDQPIPRREFELIFEFDDYQLPNKKPRKAWLRMSASKGMNAHLPVFLANVCDTTHEELQTPQDIISALTEMPVKLQLMNKKSKKDPSKTYQNVIWDAVRHAGGELPTPSPAPITDKDLNEDIPDPSEEAPF